MSTASAYYRHFRENGRRIAKIRDHLAHFAQTHRDLAQIEAEANRLILKAGGEPAFKKVPGYYWATCISVNDAIVHGIPKGKVSEGDLITIDTGMFYQGTTTDTAVSLVIGKPSPFQTHFLHVGRQTLKKTLACARVGTQIRDLSHTMQRGIEKAGFNVTRNLTGHGVGATMHEAPPIPCFTSRDPALSTRLREGMVLAVEIMYMAGNWPLVTDADGWTMRTADGSLAAVFEEDVIITAEGPEIITQTQSA